MTCEGFTKLVKFLEGAFRESLTPMQRDAYWLALAPDDDAEVFHQAIAHVRSDRAHYGFPKPGDLVPRSARPTYQELESRDTAKRYGQLQEPALTPEESAAVVAALRAGDPEPPLLKPIRLADRLRLWRKQARQ